MHIKSLFNKKAVVVLTLLGAAFIAGAVFFWGSGATAKKEEKPAYVIRPVKTVTIANTTIRETRSFPGLVNAARETKLAFRVSGPLVAFDVRIGQQMKKGELIARIDPRDFEVNVMRLSAVQAEAQAGLKAMKSGARAEDIARLEAELSAARSRLSDAKKNLERQKRLLANRVVAQSQYDNTKTALDGARATVEMLVQGLKKAKSGARSEDIEAAEAGIRRLAADLKAARHALQDTKLKAPFNGYVSRRYVEKFENVEEREAVVSFLDVSSVEVDTTVPEDLLVRRKSIAEIYCTLDVYPARHFVATVKEIGRKTDSANQSYPLTVILKVPEGLVVEPGMAATLHVSLKNTNGQNTDYTLPAGAVFADAQGRSCVWRVDNEHMKVVKTRVTTGALSHDAIRILSGLKAGDRVVTAGARFLREGQPVRLLRSNGKDRS